MDHSQAVQEHSVLFSSGRLGRYELPRRVLMAPMTRNRADQANAPTELMARYYAQRASAGLIITEATQVAARGMGYPGTPGIHTPRQVAGWRRVVKGVHGRGGHIFLQLWHAGRISHPSLLGGERPVAPSAIRPAGEVMTGAGAKPYAEPRALGKEEIRSIVGQFEGGARNALEAGFDGVEIHAANGYLIDQFLRDGSNRRDDCYGGALDNRARLLLEITSAVCTAAGADRVGVRLSPLSAFNDMYDGHPEATFSGASDRLNPFGLAYLHIVGQNDFTGRPESFDLGKLRDVFHGPLVVNGGYDRARGERAIASGAADFVSYGRLFLANPDLPERFRRDAPLNEPQPETFYGGDRRGYTDYPFLDEAESTAAVHA